MTALFVSALSEMIPEKQKLLLHVCCAPCGTHPIRLLSDLFDVKAFFYNPNIQPESEYNLRLAEMEKLASRWHISFFSGPYDPEFWNSSVRGHETEPEGGSRCLICYRVRLEHTAGKAMETGCSVFATTLSISPHKKAGELNRIGLEVAQRTGSVFFPADFKKKEGFKIAGQICREEGLYRQNYCGCPYSRNRNPDGS